MSPSDWIRGRNSVESIVERRLLRAERREARKFERQQRRRAKAMKIADLKQA